MASLDTGGGDDHGKKGPGVKKAKKLSTRVDMTPHGGSWVPVNYLLHFYHNHGAAYGDEPVHA